MANNDPQDLYLNFDEIEYDDGKTKDAIVIIGLDGHSVYYSNQLSKMLRGKKLHLEDGLFNEIHPDDKDYIKQIFNDAISNKSVENFSEIEFRMLDKDGSPIWLSALPSNYYGEDGNLIGFITSIRDITKRKEREIELENILDQYSKSLEKTKFYKELIIHEVNNIFSVIQMSSEILRDNINRKDKIVKNPIDLIQQSVKRGSTLINNVQKLSNLENESEIILKNVEIIKILDNTIHYIQQSYPDREIQIDIDAMRKDYYVKANELIIDIFYNLLQNAVKYNKNSIVKIIVKISKLQIDDSPYIKMQFLDNGVGLSDLQKNLIFLSVPKHYQETKGMGLGLSLVKRIIELFGGRIWVENRNKNNPSKGSNFVLLLKESFI
ncbi:MAG: ATP-binding protein [Promethearchaeota archaeon]